MIQFLTWYTGLQAGAALTALYFVIRIAMLRTTPSYIYIIFAIGLSAMAFRFGQIVINFDQYEKALTLGVVLINSLIPFSMAAGFGSIYKLLKHRI